MDSKDCTTADSDNISLHSLKSSHSPTPASLRPEDASAERAVPIELTSPPYSAFSHSRRRFILGIVTAAGFFGTLCGAIYLPAIVLFQDTFHTSAAVINATLSLYMAILAVAPLFGAAASDHGGRKTVYICGLGSFLVANILLATLPAHIVALFILRIFQAFGSCIVFSVGAGTVSDIVEPKGRAYALSIFLLGPQLGPVLGPLIGGQFATPTRWRWIFGFLALAAAPVYFAILFCLPETLRSLVGNGDALAKKSWIFLPSFRQKPIEGLDSTRYPRTPRPTIKKFMQLLRYPPHLIVSVIGALQYAGIYAIFITFPRVWQKEFGFTAAEVGYLFLVPGVVLFATSLGTGWLSDKLRARKLKNSPDGRVAPEHRLPIQIFALVIAAAGKMMYGWFSQQHKSPVGGLVGSALASVGTAMITVTSTSFQTECDPARAASLVALAGLLRNSGAAISAAIMGSLVQTMGYGWCFTGLGLLDIMCIPGVILILVRGDKFRAKLKSSV